MIIQKPKNTLYLMLNISLLTSKKTDTIWQSSTVISFRIGGFRVLWLLDAIGKLGDDCEHGRVLRHQYSCPTGSALIIDGLDAAVWVLWVVRVFLLSEFHLNLFASSNILYIKVLILIVSYLKAGYTKAVGEDQRYFWNRKLYNLC